MKDYNPQNRGNAKRLRKEMTSWERKLWYCFLKDYKYKIKKQELILDYIVDFYCARAKVVIELDGGGHFETKEAQDKDKKRDENLEKFGLKVLRIINLDIDKNFEGVCEYIDTEINKRISPSQSRS